MTPNDRYGTYTKILYMVSGIVNCIAVGVSFIMVGVITQVVANDINCKEGFVSFLGGILIGLVCGCGPVATPLVRQLGMRILGSLSGLLSFSALMMLSLTRSKLVFGIAICIHGVCMGTLFSTMFVVAVHVFPIHFLQVNAVLLVSSALGTAAAPLLQILIDTYGWRGALAILAAMHLHITVASMRMNSQVGRVESLTPRTDYEDPADQNASVKNSTSNFNKILELLHLDVFKSNAQLVALFLSGICAGIANVTFFLSIVPHAEQSGINPLIASALEVPQVFTCLIVRVSLIFVSGADVALIMYILAAAQFAEFLAFFVLTVWNTVTMFCIGSALHGFAMGSQWYSIASLAALLATRKEYVDYSISWCVASEGIAAIMTAFIDLCITEYYQSFQICFCVQFLAIALVVYMIIRLWAPRPI